MTSFDKPFSPYKTHPWHGIPIGENAPSIVNAYIEIIPNDPIKYEIDKWSGHLKVDRPQKFSSLPPTLYGLVPQTYCGKAVAALCGREVGDGDPLDICVLSELPITRAEVLLEARIIGGLRMIDGDEVDDKIVAILNKDEFYDHVKDIGDLPPNVIKRLRHYFLSYKSVPGDPVKVSIEETYGKKQAEKVIEASRKDYAELMKTLKV